jgi:hypothetical protein
MSRGASSFPCGVQSRLVCSQAWYPLVVRNPLGESLASTTPSNLGETWEWSVSQCY